MSEDKKMSDLEMLEDLKHKIHEGLEKKGYKVGDLLKVIEMKNKLSVTGKAEKKFWNMIDELRQETLPKSKKNGKTRKKDKKQES
ncbi:MAG: hypothetical protein AB1746_07240 [Candidatus Zixiibacteriota bacterium]